MAAYFLAKKFEPEVKEIVVAELNNHLLVPVDVEDINLSLIQRFPYASLRFSHVVIPEVGPGKTESDTLLYADDLYLQIALIDFFKQNYTISEAEINGGFFKVAMYPDRTDNFRFWKARSDSSGKAAISLTNVDFQDFRYTLENAGKLNLDIEILKGRANGDFGNQAYTIDADCDLLVHSIGQAGDTLYLDQELSGDFVCEIDHQNSFYKFSSKDLNISDQKYQVDGAFAPKEIDQWVVDIKTTGGDLEKMVRLIPSTNRWTFQKYQAKGDADVDLKLKYGKSLHILVGFDNVDGSFQHHTALGKAKISNAKGVYSLKNDMSTLTLDALQASIGGGKLEAKGKIVDFKSPAFDLKMKGKIDLSELKNLINISLADELDGSIALDGTLNGKLAAQSAEAKLDMLRGIDFNGVITLSDGLIRMKNQSQLYDEINGNLSLENNAITTKSLSARVNKSPFTLSGEIVNALPYLTQRGQTLKVDAEFRADRLDFNSILTQEESKADTTYKLELPRDLDFDLDILVQELSFRRFEAKDVSGRARLSNGVLTLNPFEFKSCNGLVKTNIAITEEGDAFAIQSNSILKDMWLNEVFYSFENFGQSLIRPENIEGRTNADIRFECQISSDLQVKSSSIFSEVDLMVIDGKLHELEAFQEIGAYLRQSGIYKSFLRIDELERELKHIEFDTLANQIVIKDEVVTIPRMDISSSAMNLQGSGTHSFSNEIDYAFNFKLSEVLRKGKGNSNEFGHVVDDGTGLNIFLKMYGTTSNPQFSMDKDAARAKRNNQFQEEKQTFKSILKEEFGLFKKDTTLQALPDPEPKGETQFEVTWEGSTKSDTSKSAEKDKKKKPNPPKQDDEDDEDLFGGDDDL